MSDLGVLVPILAPSGFGTRQSAASNTAEGGERATVSAVSVSASTTIDQSAASQAAATVDPLTGLAIPILTAGLVPLLQEAEEDPGQPDQQTSQQAGEQTDGAPAASTNGEAGATENGENNEDGDGSPGEEASASAASFGPTELTPEQQQVVRELQRTDAEIRRHEQAHASAGGQYAGAPSYDYTRGPDGRLYAIGGDVQIDVAPVPGNPQATIAKMQVVRRAALAPANPSPQDRRVAAIAQQRIIEARQEQADLELEERQAARENRDEAQQRAAGLQAGSSSGIPGAESSNAAAATIPALVAGASTVTAPVTTNGELLNVIA